MHFLNYVSISLVCVNLIKKIDTLFKIKGTENKQNKILGQNSVIISSTLNLKSQIEKMVSTNLLRICFM